MECMDERIGKTHIAVYSDDHTMKQCLVCCVAGPVC